jgi:glycosyltransferase involved in cell wall biosynthesis
MMNGRSLSVVIPTWNEAEGIAYTLRSMPQEVDEVVVVDALSRDGTADIARACGARVVPEARRGYGRALRTGFNSAKGDIIVSADGDGTYPLGGIPEVAQYLIDRDLQFVSCARLPLSDPGAMRRKNLVGNVVLTSAATLLYRYPFQDILSGMWLMTREAWVSLDVHSDGWNLSEEIKIRAMLAFGERFEEYHIHYAERLGETKLAAWRVGAENLIWMLLMRAELDIQAKAMLFPRPKRFDGRPPKGG